MSTKRPRIFGTTPAAVEQAEAELGFRLSPSFREWLFRNNGLSAEHVHIFPVFDVRDPRTTWDSLVRQYDGGQWGGEIFEDEGQDFSHLLPFASVGSGDLYCFDYGHRREDGETPVVLWSHETGETQERGGTFAGFVERIQQGGVDD